MLAVSSGVEHLIRTVLPNPFRGFALFPRHLESSLRRDAGTSMRDARAPEQFNCQRRRIPARLAVADASPRFARAYQVNKV